MFAFQSTRSKITRDFFLFIYLTVIFASVSTNISYSQKPAPVLNGWITDQAGILSPQEKNSLAGKLQRYNDTTSNQIAVLIIPSLENSPIEDFALAVARGTKIGTKNLNNGVLFLIVTNDRKMRIEVGSGLEGPLPDALAGQIIRNEVSPYFKVQKYYGGIASGIDGIIKATAGEYKVKAVKSQRGSKGSSGFGTIIFIIVILIAIFSRRRFGFLPFLGLMSGFGGGGFGGRGGGGSDGGGFGGFGGGGFSGGGASGDW